jgi:hypothetical protein
LTLPPPAEIEKKKKKNFRGDADSAEKRSALFSGSSTARR